MQFFRNIFRPTSAPAPRLRHTVLTSFHRKGYETYGRQFLESFIKFWPEDVQVWVYAEDVSVDIVDPRIRIVDHNATLHKLIGFREEYGALPEANGRNDKYDPEYNFRWDAIRFANKVFAVTDAIRNTAGQWDQLIWLDADTVTHRQIPSELLDRLAPREKQLAAYLNRRGYPECGWVGYNLNHPMITLFADRFEQTYLSGKFLEMPESHDSYVFWMIVKKMERAGEAKFRFLGSNRAKGHIFINSELGGYMDHLKGDRKTEGKSRKSDLKIARKESWWKE